MIYAGTCECGQSLFRRLDEDSAKHECIGCHQTIYLLRGEGMTKFGTLHLIKSKNPPMFDTPLRVVWMRDPKVGEAFLFSAHVSSNCNLSTVKKIDKYKGFKVITTLNSYYVLTEEINEPS